MKSRYEIEKTRSDADISQDAMSNKNLSQAARRRERESSNGGHSLTSKPRTIGRNNDRKNTSADSFTN